MSYIIGLTGGIASGKSTVVAAIRQAGYQVIDADQLVHDLQKKGGRLYQALLDWLGTDILLSDGALNRPKLAQLIFSDPVNRQRSAEMQGKIIREELAKARDNLSQTESLFFMDIPLLIEQDYLDWFDEIWLVSLAPEIQKERLILRNGLTDNQAQERIASQMSLEDKLPYADLVLDNNQSIGELLSQVQVALDNLKP